MERKKRVFLPVLLILCIFFLPVCCGSCSGTARSQTKELKILCIGNSFSQDAMAYLPPVLSELAPDWRITCGVCYTSGARISDHLSWDQTGKRYTVFNYWKEGRTSWTRLSGARSKSLREALALEDWNMIIIHGVSSDVKTLEGTEAMLASAQEMQSLLNSRMKNPFQLIWYQWMSRPHDEDSADQMFERIACASEKAQSLLNCRIIPVGAAFTAARKVPALQRLGESGNMLYRDGKHMQAGGPSMLAAYTTALSVMKCAGWETVSLSQSTWLPDRENTRAMRASNGKGGGMTHGEPEDLSAEEWEMIRRIAEQTVEDVFASP